MNLILKTVKQEFISYEKENEARIKYQKKGNLETLSILPVTNDKKKSVQIDFFFMQVESTVDVKISYKQKHENNNQEEVSFSFSDLRKDKEIPNIDSDYLTLIKESFAFEIVEGKLKSTVPPQTQAENFTRVIKNSWNIIVNYLDTVF